MRRSFWLVLISFSSTPLLFNYEIPRWRKPWSWDLSRIDDISFRSVRAIDSIGVPWASKFIALLNFLGILNIETIGAVFSHFLQILVSVVRGAQKTNFLNENMIVFVWLPFAD